VSFLEKATGQPVPQTLQAAIEHTYHGHEEASLQRGWVLQVKDPDLLSASTLQSQKGVIHLGSRAALIPEAERERILASLIAEGILPEVSQDAKVKG
jgi:hypothetical protein